MSDTKQIPIAEATNAMLRHHAGTNLGIDGIKDGQQTTFLLGKIELAAPGTTHVIVPLTMVEGAAEAQDIANASPGATRVDGERDARHRLTTHYRDDPKVLLEVATSSNPADPREVHVAVNGDTIRITRGEAVEVPYRFYRALQDGREKVPMDGDEINPATGLPIVVFRDRPSYSVSVQRGPDAAAVSAWEARMASSTFAPDGREARV